MSGMDVEVAVPFWLDRPDHEAMEVALAASDAGFDALWIGEMAPSPWEKAAT
ncbi:hypothetical protein LAUMK4_01296 [Mycobacterium persicum]|uniref:LLM class F420-dependent oxidoreductase n=1 Tax=Mycobacterium persicum TaxID=1487726 RepID=A0ABY6RES4_9MYCO|nr:hypothetical protein LAUMK4_01296 [Mycobacterium persicum]